MGNRLRGHADLSYTYDAGGNRLSKTDNDSGVVTTYHYDIQTDDGIDGGQHNNRLLGYEVSGPIVEGSSGPMLKQITMAVGIRSGGGALAPIWAGREGGVGKIRVGELFWLVRQTASRVGARVGFLGDR